MRGRLPRGCRGRRRRPPAARHRRFPHSLRPRVSARRYARRAPRQCRGGTVRPERAWPGSRLRRRPRSSRGSPGSDARNSPYGGVDRYPMRHRAQTIRDRLRRGSRRYADWVDVLSDAVTAMRTGRPHSSRVRLPTPFGRRFPPVDGAGFHIVLQGSCWLFPPDDAPIALGVGDVAFLPRGGAHGLADSPSTPLADAAATSPAQTRPVTDDDAPRTGRHLANRSGTVMLCGAYLLDRSRAHPLLSDLPDVIHLPARIGLHPGLRAAVDLLGDELDQPQPGGDAMLPALLEVLLLHILRAWFDEQATHGTATGWAAALRDPAVAAALRAIHGDPSRQWTVE